MSNNQKLMVVAYAFGNFWFLGERDDTVPIKGQILSAMYDQNFISDCSITEQHILDMTWQAYGIDNVETYQHLHKAYKQATSPLISKQHVGTLTTEGEVAALNTMLLCVINQVSVTDYRGAL